MKIASIDIQEFRQFKNLKLDLTYPTGHEKEGEPLDKVCIIGQSGTGKTNLLNLIYLKQFIIKKRNTSIPKKYRLNVSKTKIFFNKGADEIDQFVINTTFHYLPVRSTLRNFDFLIDNEENSKRLWKNKAHHIKIHANKRSEYVFAVTNAFGRKSVKEIQELVFEKENWEKTNPNPLFEIANLLNPVIGRFGLKIRTDIYNLHQLDFIPVMDKNGSEVPQELWSTGTNQIIYKTYLYSHINQKTQSF